jgi:branched-chain amino acid aminotransferase
MTMTLGQGKIWYDGKFVDWNNATTHVLSHVIHYGSSVFESMRCYKTKKGSAIFRVADHVDRLFDSAKIYRMRLPFSPDELCQAIIETVRVNNLQECYVRPFAFRGYGNMGVNPLSNPVHVAIAAWDWGKYLGQEAIEKGVSVKVSSWNKMAPNTIPSLAKAGGNYLNAQLAKMEAIEEGFEEAIILDIYGYVSEGSAENVFLVRNGVIFTPPTSASILAGMTRHCVFVIAKDLGIRIEQHLLPREALYIADEVFFSGTAAEITPVTSVDKIPIGDGKRGPITAQIQKHFFGVVRGEIEDTHAWLTHIQ